MPPNKDRCDVFHDDDSWSQNANDSMKLLPQSTSLSVNSSLKPGVADVLAREAAADDIDSLCVRLRPVAYIAASPDVWPVLSKDSICIIVYLHLPFAGHTSTFKPQIKPANPGKQTSKVHGSPESHEARIADGTQPTISQPTPNNAVEKIFKTASVAT